jgi:putative DNA primase/helicase
MLMTNYKPGIDGTDTALARRLRLLPFGVTFGEATRDNTLRDTLKGELPGILRWIVAGAVAWYASGLGCATAERAAANEYLAEHDPVGNFLIECCIAAPGKKVGATDLYGAYVTWANTNGTPPCGHRRFGDRLTKEGYAKDRDSITGRVFRLGVVLSPNSPNSYPESPP